MNLEQQAAPAATPDAEAGVADALGLADVFSFGGGTSGGLELTSDGPAPDVPPASGGNEPAPAEPAPAGAEPAPAPTPAAPPAPAAPAPAPAPAAPAALPAIDEAALRTNSLETQLAAAMAEVQRLKATPAAPTAAPTTGTPPAPGGGTGSGEEAPPEYTFAIPKELGEALLSDDPELNLRGIQHLINGLSVAIHTRVRGEFEQKLSNLRTSIQQPVQEAAERERGEAVLTNYYASFPAHKTPAATTLVATEAARLQAEFPGCDWSPQYLNALGARVNTRIAELTGQPAPQAPAPAAPPKPAAMVPVHAPRGSEAVGGNDPDSIMLSVFDGPPSPM